MGREGPCFHCGIKHTPLWRVGPPEKPVLCNACGSRWRIRGTLAAYTPKHASTKSSKQKQLRLNDKQTIPYIKSNLRGKVAKSQTCSTCCEDHSNNKCTSGSTASSSRNCTHMENVVDTARKFEWNFNIPKKKRSPPRQIILTNTERFHKQLLQILHEQECAKVGINEEYPLVYHNINWMMPPNETRAGAAHIKAYEKENQAMDPPSPS